MSRWKNFIKTVLSSQPHTSTYSSTPVKAMFCYYFKTFYFYLNGQKSRKPHLLPGGRAIFTYLTLKDKVGVLIGKRAYLEI